MPRPEPIKGDTSWRNHLTVISQQLDYLIRLFEPQPTVQDDGPTIKYEGIANMTIGFCEYEFCGQKVAAGQKFARMTDGSLRHVDCADLA